MAEVSWNPLKKPSPQLFFSFDFFELWVLSGKKSLEDNICITQCKVKITKSETTIMVICSYKKLVR